MARSPVCGGVPTALPIETTSARARNVNLAVLVAALGYFVDVYDLLLFSVVRVKSLEALGVPAPELLDRGVFLINMQMAGMLVGGVLWGILGDRRGRLSVLFGSIILYSLANLANGMPDRLAGLTGGTLDSLQVYALVRFIAGVGLAGELGAGITLVSESMRKETRGFGTTLVAAVGICGALAAVVVGRLVDWRTAYFIGGGLGLALLVLRLGVLESGLYRNLQTHAVPSGRFVSLFTSATRAKRYLSLILVGVPIWYVVGILVSFAPELGSNLGMRELPTAPDAVFAAYVGLALGDLGSGLLSQLWRTRKKVLATFLGLTALGVLAYFTVGGTSLPVFYGVCVALGIGTGYWAVFVTVASEQFGTNLRATVTTTAPNFVRGSLVIVTLAFQGLKPLVGGAAPSALVVGVATLFIAFVALRGLDETFGKDLDFVES